MAPVRSQALRPSRGASSADENAPSSSLSPSVSSQSKPPPQAAPAGSSRAKTATKKVFDNLQSLEKNNEPSRQRPQRSATQEESSRSTRPSRSAARPVSASASRKRERSSFPSSPRSSRRTTGDSQEAKEAERDAQGPGREKRLVPAASSRRTAPDSSARAEAASNKKAKTASSLSSSRRGSAGLRETERGAETEGRRQEKQDTGRTRARERKRERGRGGTAAQRKAKDEDRLGCIDTDDEVPPRVGDSVVDEAAVKTILKSEVPNTVFKVFCTHCEPNYSQPWTTRRQTTSTSTGFVTLDANGEKCLLTNAHSVEHAAVVQVRKRGDHQKYEAEVLCIGLECDLAMLRVSDPDFWKGLGPPLQWGASPRLGDPVTVVGYPLGGDNSSVTQGVVSRTDLQQYCLGSCSLLAIQIDAAINPGNSGGPALNRDSQCVGIAFQSLKDGDTENIGYIIPSEVVGHFLEDYRRHGRCLGFGDGGFTWQKLENKSLRQALALKSKDEGILIKKLDGGGAAKEVLQKGDILLEISGKKIASDGTVAFRNGERILFTWLLSQMYVGERCAVKILRSNKERKETFSVGKLSLLVPANSDLRRPQYLIVGGLVFVPLSEPFLKSEYGEDFESRAPVRLLDKWQHGFQSFPGEQFVILSHVLAHDVTVGYEHLHNVQVQQFNGTSVKTLQHLAELVEKSTEEYWRFDLDHDEVVVLEAAAARRALPHILQRNMIRSHKSEDV
ncbi:hypothetical protein NCLIV_068150 [Neospora caninum Liverpool]|uniref:Trypsin-like serine protease n=1 Tax=Neospora caninum (strain Liverpool) TaxID=572307 RepID=F0VRP3_NEOCL|nr:hypothetical protein NCLIV_068150 [Neospora caninum Liverpool]CBZ56391.1 hypothetical protein NCLIV_068150 [Neospora caninum Liverpool]CEL71151.1 TPA: trypsin-like serine protease [Neospora caninum Liverpool]|eukprot:XP_003886416.1 hypothetical protein NCLIV_068150 [Neospora caninum Liverpool]